MIDIIIGIVTGLIWGSFLGVVKSRLDDPKLIFWGRSKCPKCKKTLGAFDLIPILSFLVLRGRCRYCKKPIAPLHLAVEILSAILAVAVYTVFGLNIASVFLYLSLSFLLMASLSDIEDQEVDVAFFIIGLATAIIFNVLSHFSLESIIYGAITFALIPFLLYLISHEKWIGLGDAFFALWAGILVGFPQSLLMVFVAFFLGALFGIIKLLAGASSHRIAFGPFLALSAVLGVFWSRVILDYYLNIFY